MINYLISSGWASIMIVGGLGVLLIAVLCSSDKAIEEAEIKKQQKGNF